MGAKRADRGASLVELAFALPLLIMLILGMVSAGIAFNHGLSITHAARESGRFAATLPVTNFGSMNLWLDAVAAQAIQDASGSLDLGVPGLYVCTAYVHPSGTVASDLTTMREQDNSGTIYTPGGTCFVDGRPVDERRVQVRVARDTDFNVLVFTSTITLDSEGVNRFEAAGGL